MKLEVQGAGMIPSFCGQVLLVLTVIPWLWGARLLGVLQDAVLIVFETMRAVAPMLHLLLH